MEITQISYHKTFNLGNYSNEKIGIDIKIAPGEDPMEAFAEAKKQVEKSHLFFKHQPTYEKAKDIVAHPDNYTGRDVKQAQETIEIFEQNYSDMMKLFTTTSRQLNLPQEEEMRF